MKPNKFGRYKKSDVVSHGYQIIDYGYTASEIKELTGIYIPPEKRLEHCIGFTCKQSWRGCVPVFDLFDIAIKKQQGKL